MKLRTFLPIAIAAASVAAFGLSAETVHLFLKFDGTTSQVAGSIWTETEIVEYRNGDDPITHKRAGKAKYKNIVLKRGYVNDSSMDALVKKVLAGTTDRKSGSVIYLDRTGSEETAMEFEDDATVRFPASGFFAQDEDGDGIAVLMKAKEKANRTKCANNARMSQPTRPTRTSVQIDGATFACGGWTPLTVRCTRPDIDGDGVPDDMRIDSGNVRLVLSASDAPFITDWEKNTVPGGDFMKRMSFSWGTKSGALTATFNATLISVCPGVNGEIEIVCATENVQYHTR